MTKKQEQQIRDLDATIAENDAHLAAIRERQRELDAEETALNIELRDIEAKIKVAEATLPSG